MEVPFWALSPSPFSILFYLILTVYGYRKLPHSSNLKKRIVVFTDAILIVGFTVLLTDTLWIVASGLRFGWTYPDSVLQLVFAGGRNIAGLVLCYMLIGSYFKNGLLRFQKWTWNFLILNCLFLAFWFWGSPSPAYTDWTYAIRHNYPQNVIVASFLFSHFLGKLLVFLIFTSLFKPLKVNTSKMTGQKKRQNKT